MLFNSYTFLLVFLPLFLAIYWSLPTLTQKKFASAIGSYAFYSVWSLKFAALMFFSTSVDYFSAQKIEDAKDQRTRKMWLVVSIVINLGILGVFKYYNFFASSLNWLLPKPFLPALNVILPIGISFYTFESMSYCIDVYRGNIPAARRMIDYVHFVTMFPRLVAGPIVRYSDFYEQVKRTPASLTADACTEAMHFFVCGLIKKLVLADYIASTVDVLFANTGSLHFASAWGAALGYTAQLYMDFSGYSDMAVGLGLLLGYRFVRNFNLPYASQNIAEFWRRWHISLSSWLKDYLYISLGGNRSGRSRTLVNLFLTMLLGGLWHGAEWTFVLWGAFHGSMLAIHQIFSRRFGSRLLIPRGLRHAMTFFVVTLGWVMFRAPTVVVASDVYAAMFGGKGLGLEWLGEHVPFLGMVALALAIGVTIDTYDLKPRKTVRSALVYAVGLVICIIQFAKPSPFLYFQF